MVEAKGDGTSVSQKIRVAPLNQIVTIGEDFHSQVGDGKIRTTLDRVRWEGYDKKKKKYDRISDSHVSTYPSGPH
jgi:hypothetical protein